MAATLHSQFAANAALGLSHSVAYAPERPFLTELVPGLSRRDLADAIVGNISAKVKCSKTALDVLRVLICYTRGSHDRVWTSLVRIMKRAEKYIPGWKTCSVKTVQRCVHFWIKMLLVKRIDDPLEKFSGPGEHLWVDEGNEKQGDGPVNHYDLHPLIDFVPAYLIQAFEALIGGGHFTPPPAPAPFVPIDVEAETGDPFDEAQEPARQAKKDARERAKRSKIGFRALVTQSQERIATGETELDDCGFDDPFSDLSENNQFGGQASENLPPSPSLLETFGIAGGTPAQSVRNVEMSQKNSNENETGKAHSEGAAKIPIDVTKLSPIGNQYPPVRPRAVDGRTGANITANERSQGDSEPASGKTKKASPQWLSRQPREVQELARKGMDGFMARRIYLDMKEEWVRAVLVYGRQQEARDGDRKAGPWYVEVYKAFRDSPKDKPASFPDDDKPLIDRNERSHQEALWAAEKAALMKQQAAHAVPDALPASVEPLPRPLPGWLSSLPAPAPNTPTPPAPPQPENAAPPSPELEAAWPAVLREAKACFPTPFYQSHILPLRAGTLTDGDGGTVATAVTTSRFTVSTFDEKPQHLATLVSLLAAELGIAPQTLTLKIVLTPGPIGGRRE